MYLLINFWIKNTEKTLKIKTFWGLSCFNNYIFILFLKTTQHQTIWMFSIVTPKTFMPWHQIFHLICNISCAFNYDEKKKCKTCQVSSGNKLKLNDSKTYVRNIPLLFLSFCFENCPSKEFCDHGESWGECFHTPENTIYLIIFWSRSYASANLGSIWYWNFHVLITSVI